MKQIIRRALRTATYLALLVPASILIAQESGSGELVVTRPVISLDISPLESIAPVAADGHRGDGFLRKPPGDGPFPAILLIHGGFERRPTEWLRDYSLRAHPSRFLAAGYVVAVTTYRSRDIDPQSTVSLEDSLAAVDYLKKLPYVDPDSVAVRGTSGGGDLALEVAAATDVAAIVAEEPASMLFTGILNAQSPKEGERFGAGDATYITDDPSRYYTAEYQEFTREKISRIQSPILILQGDQGGVPPFDGNVPRFNEEILIPELNAAGKDLSVITYPGELHSFAFYSLPERAPRPEVVLRAFEDIDAFLRRHLVTQPIPMDPARIDYVPW